jgi:hypothetical protein
MLAVPCKVHRPEGRLGPASGAGLTLGVMRGANGSPSVFG